MSYVDISNVWRPLTTHTLAATTSSGSTATSAFDKGVSAVMVTATAACFVDFAGTPTAATSSTYIAANTPYWFKVSDEAKGAAITGTGTATVYITELSK